MSDIKESSSVPVKEICDRIFHGLVLDVFYLIYRKQPVSKSALINIIQEKANGKTSNDANIKSQSFRTQIDRALATLEGALFVRSFKGNTKGAPTMYVLSSYGEIAQEYLKEIFETENKESLYGSVIVAPIYREEIEHIEKS